MAGTSGELRHLKIEQLYKSTMRCSSLLCGAVVVLLASAQLAAGQAANSNGWRKLRQAGTPLGSDQAMAAPGPLPTLFSGLDPASLPINIGKPDVKPVELMPLGKPDGPKGPLGDIKPLEITKPDITKPDFPKPDFNKPGKPDMPPPSVNISLCSAGLTECPGGVCTNVTSDVGNCGACGTICPSNWTCTDGICAERAVQCGSGVTFRGNEGNYTVAVNIGSGGPTFDFIYNAIDLPDRFNVYLPNGTRIFSILAGDPGNPSPSCRCRLCAGEETFPDGRVTLARPEGVTAVKVVVNGYCANTGWNFDVNCAGAAPANATTGDGR